MFWFARIVHEMGKLRPDIPFLVVEGRGGLVETLQDAGFLFDIPLRYQMKPTLLPTLDDVQPWLDTLVRLWDDPAFYETQRQRCLAAAARFHPDRLAEEYESYLARVMARKVR